MVSTSWLPWVSSLDLRVVLVLMKVKVAQSCLTLSNHMDYIVHRVLQARKLERVAFPPSMYLPNSGIELGSPALQVDSLQTELSGKPHFS